MDNGSRVGMLGAIFFFPSFFPSFLPHPPDDVSHKTIPHQFRIMNKKKAYLFKGKTYISLS